MKININGQDHQITGPDISFEEVVALAKQSHEASVTYAGPRHGDSRRTGTMFKGKVIAAEDGMQFTAVVTGGA